MARRSTASTAYATAPYGMADEAFLSLIAEIQAWPMRSDVRRTAVLLTVAALTRCWPASHFQKRERDGWTHKAKAAFRVSEVEIADITGTSRARVHTALTKMIDAGFIVELAPLTHRGEGRGTKPPTYALKCHARGKVDSTNIDIGSVIGSERADQSRPAQTWRL